MQNPLLFSQNTFYEGSEARKEVTDVLKNSRLGIETSKNLPREYIKLPHPDNVPYIFVGCFFDWLNTRFDGSLAPLVPVDYDGKFLFKWVRDVKSVEGKLDSLVLSKDSEILFNRCKGLPLNMRFGFPILKVGTSKGEEKKNYMFKLAIPESKVLLPERRVVYDYSLSG